MVAEIAIPCVTLIVLYAMRLRAETNRNAADRWETYRKERESLDGQHRGELGALRAEMDSVKVRLGGLEVQRAMGR